jgi:hypothetical protein
MKIQKTTLQEVVNKNSLIKNFQDRPTARNIGIANDCVRQA